MGKSRYSRKTSRAAMPGYGSTGGQYGRFRGRGKLPTGVTRELKFFVQGFESKTLQGGALKIQVMPNFNAGTVQTAGSMVAEISQGTSAYQREGRKIVVSQIHIRFETDILKNDAAGVNYNVSPSIRWLLVKDTQCNGLSASPQDVLNINTPSANILNFNNQNAAYTFKNHFNEDRFQIIIDETISQPRIANEESTGPFSVNKIIYPNTPILYSDGTTQDIALVKSNNFFMLFMSDQEDIASSTYEVSGMFEIRYYDD